MAVVFGVVEILAGLMPTFDTTALLLVPAGLCMLSFSTAANSSVQLGADPAMRGRVMALYLMCFMAGTPFGAPAIGWVAEAFGPRWGMVGGGLISAVAATVIGLVLARQRHLHIGELVARIEHSIEDLRPNA
jgi:MFS family permease